MYHSACYFCRFKIRGHEPKIILEKQSLPELTLFHHNCFEHYMTARYLHNWKDRLDWILTLYPPNLSWYTIHKEPPLFQTE